VFDSLTGQVVHVNDAFTDMFGFAEGHFDSIAAFWAQAVPDPDARHDIGRACSLVFDQVHLPNHASSSGGGEATLTRFDGTTCRVDIRPATCEHLRILAFIDVTALRTREEQLEILASFDDMTSFLNRRAFLERAGNEARLANAQHEPLSLIVFDLDKFKSINDSYGHTIGDRVLQILPQAVSSWLRSADLVGRTGGEEFMIVLPGTATDGARLVAERVRTSIRELVVHSLDDKEVRFTASFGISELLPLESSIENLIIRADTALYLAKSKGGNVVTTSS
jgi:diguanylate cyclase (GGDEF)-like protein